MKPLPQSCLHSVALAKEWFEGDALALAPKLLGKIVKRGACEGIIVETEAYMSDAASHATKFSKRAAPMRETYGHWYIYFTYGMHWCANVTTDKKSAGAVLIRAVEPLAGLALMKRRRGTSVLKNVCSGPAKFCQAFGITGKDNGCKIGNDFAIYDAPNIPKSDIGISARVGISSGKNLPWRFYIKGNQYISHR